MKLHPHRRRSFTSHPSVLALEVSDVLLQAFKECKDAVALMPAVLLWDFCRPPRRKKEESPAQ